MDSPSMTQLIFIMCKNKHSIQINLSFYFRNMIDRQKLNDVKKITQCKISKLLDKNNLQSYRIFLTVRVFCV